jgi:hypothetical protein
MELLFIKFLYMVFGFSLGVVLMAILFFSKEIDNEQTND